MSSPVEIGDSVDLRADTSSETERTSCGGETTSTDTENEDQSPHDDERHLAAVGETDPASTSTSVATATSTTATGPVTRHDYRIHRKEVETVAGGGGGGLLEVVPEELTSPKNREMRMLSTTSSVGVGPSEPESCSTFYQIPESNASEAGFSECSFQSEVFNCRQVLTKTEALSAKQQVALWLTRTSMSDLSNVPSLKSLVQVAGNGASGEKSTSSKMSFKNIIPRNHSAKSLAGSIGGYGHASSDKCERSELEFVCETDRMMPSPIRKCETVIALAGLSPKSTAQTTAGGTVSCTPSVCQSRAPTPSTVAAAGAGGGGSSSAYPCCSSTAGSCAGSRKNSSFNLFARMSQENRSGRRNQTSHPNHYPASVAGTATPYARSVIGEPTNGYGSVCESPFPGLRPVNRLRSTSSIMCSRCTSILSVNASRMTSRATSQMSLFPANRRLSAMVGGASTSAGNADDAKEPEVVCKICLLEYTSRDMAVLNSCGCSFCKECMAQYVVFEVMSGSYDISCPDPECDQQGVLQVSEVESLAGKDVAEKYRKFRLNTEVGLDKTRAWCPQANCETICHICSTANLAAGPVEVNCPSCQKAFCSNCSAAWHPGMTCEESGKSLVKRAGTSASMSAMFGASAAAAAAGNGSDAVLLVGGIEIKRCPMCHVPIERDTGCAQMMCKRCKHVFCWYCLQSLDDDFLLRHYDSGACKGQLGHSRASVIWHRAQVIGIFAAFGLLLLLASPCLLIVAPCLLCCGYKSCKNAGRGSNNNEDAKDPLKEASA